MDSYKDHGIEDLFAENGIPRDSTPNIQLIAWILLLEVGNRVCEQPLLDVSTKDLGGLRY